MLFRNTQCERCNRVYEVAFVAPAARGCPPHVAFPTGLDPGFTVVTHQPRQRLMGDFETITGPGGPQLPAHVSRFRTCARVSWNSEALRCVDKRILHRLSPPAHGRCHADIVPGSASGTDEIGDNRA